MLFNKKGFISEEALLDFEKENIILERIDFKINTHFKVKDVHEVQCILEKEKEEITPIFLGNIFSFYNMLNLTFLCSDDTSLTKILNFSKKVLISKTLDSNKTLKGFYPFKIDFLVNLEEIEGVLILVGLIEDTGLSIETPIKYSEKKESLFEYQNIFL